MKLTMSLVLLIIIALAVVFLFSSGFFNFLYESMIGAGEYGKAQKEAMGKVVIGRSCSISGTKAVIDLLNIGWNDINASPPPLEFYKIENSVDNPDFEIDSDGDGIPDGWETSKKIVDVILVTDLSNSMSQCMDEDSTYGNCPPDAEGNVSNCKYEYPSTINCTEWLEGREEGYCVNKNRYFEKVYNLKVEKDWNNCTFFPGSTCSDPNYPNLWPIYNFHYVTHRWESYSNRLFTDWASWGVSRTLPWNFTFFGENYTKLWINANGLIIPLKSGEDPWCYGCAWCPDSTELTTKRVIAPLWGNLVTSAYYDVKTNPDRVVITWVGKCGYERTNCTKVKFQAVLYRNGKIEFNYGFNDISAGCSPSHPYWQIGISNGTNYIYVNWSNINSTLFTYTTQNCEDGSVWIEGSCNSSYPYQVDINVTNCVYENSALLGTCSLDEETCSSRGKIFSGNYRFGDVVERNSCNPDECEVSSTYIKAPTEDNEWHEVEIFFDRGKGHIEVYLDGSRIINYTNHLLFSNFDYDGFGFGGATGGSNNNHLIDDVILTKYVSPEPSYSIGPEEVTPSSTYRREINITERSGNDLINFPVLIILDTLSLISQGKMRADCGDLRFTNTSEANPSLWKKLYPYWIESGCNTSETKIWVNIDELPSLSTKQIYLHYGNLSLPPMSNATATISFYDDFSSDPSSRWEVYRYMNSPSTEFYWDNVQEVVYLTKASSWKGAMAFMKYRGNLSLGFHAKFKYKAGGGSGADGFAFAFYKDKKPYEIHGRCYYGGSLALDAFSGSSRYQSKGYEVEFDSCKNYQDPSEDHIAVTETFSSSYVGDNPHYADYNGPGCIDITRTPCGSSTVECSSDSYHAGTKYEYVFKCASCSCNSSSGECNTYQYLYLNCSFYNRSASSPCSVNCNLQSGGVRNYWNFSTRVIYEAVKAQCNKSLAECDVGDTYNSSNCGYYNRSCENLDTPACPPEHSYLVSSSRVYQTKESCNESNYECDVGVVYQNCVWRNRSSCEVSACLAGEVDLGTRTEYSLWKSSCTNGECDLGVRYETACIEGSSCEVPGYFSCDQQCSPACEPSYTCCCVEGTEQHNCTLYSDYCCKEFRNCTTVTDYCCEKLNICRVSADACCAEKFKKCKITQDVCCPKISLCQSREYECCNVIAKCCKEKVKCCANIESCEYVGEVEVESCSPGGSPTPPTCQNICEIRKEAYYCENVRVRLARKLDKDFVSDVVSKGHNVGLVAYGSTVTSFKEPMNNTTILFSEIDSYEANAGQTCISCAIDKSVDLLKDSENVRVVVLMSDGAANMMLNGTYDEQMAKEEALDLACDAYQNYGIVFYTIGFGEEAEEELLKNISECTHGKFYKSANASELKKIYTQIAQEISGRMDETYKVYGNYSMKIEAATNASLSTKLLKVEPAEYVLSQYIKTNITVGNFYINVYFYDPNGNPIPFQPMIELKNYSTSQEFKKEEFYLDFKNQYSGVAFVRVEYKWYNPTQTPEGSVWLDDVFFGPAPTCERINPKVWKCGEFIITKVRGDGDPYIYAQAATSSKYLPFQLIDAQCTSRNCKYLISTPGGMTSVECS